MSMDRRSFLKLLGVGATAAVIEPTRVLRADDLLPAEGVERPDEVLVTRYSLLHEDQQRLRLYTTQVTALPLEAPCGRRCRAELCIPKELEDVVSSVVGAHTANQPNEVVLTHVGDSRGVPVLGGAHVDACLFNTEDFLVPLDWGFISRDRLVSIEYEAMLDKDATLWLALYHFPSQAGPCPPGTFGGI